MHLQLNRLAYWVATPCLLFLKIGLSPPTGGSGALVVRAITVATLVLAALALAVALLLRQPGRSAGAFIHVAFRGNLAFVGLPVVIFAFTGHPEAARAEAATALALGPVVVIYNIVAVLVLLLSQHRMSLRALMNVGRKLVTNPLIISCVAGLVWNRWVFAPGYDLPLPADRVLRTLGGSALPLALLGVGASLVCTPLKGRIVPSLCAATIKTMVGPIVGFLAARLFGADGVELLVVTLMMATPSAIVSYVLTDQLGSDSALCASAIVLSTAISAVGLSVVLLLAG
jgi:predicted permease